MCSKVNAEVNSGGGDSAGGDSAEVYSAGGDSAGGIQEAVIFTLI